MAANNLLFFRKTKYCGSGRTHNRTSLPVLSLLLLFSFGQSAITAAQAAGSDELPPGEWSLLGRGYEQHHFSPLTSIDANNVSHLGLAWYADLPTSDGIVASPLIEDGLVYEIGSYSRVWALDLRTGQLVWTYDPGVKVAGAFPSMWSLHMSRGVALLGDRLFFGTSDCRLIALNRKTGQKIWDVQACDADGTRTINSAPRVGNGKVFVGNSDVDTGLGRGSLDAFDAESGRHLWRFYTIPGDPALKENRTRANKIAAKTWSGKEWWKSAGGGSTWEGITFDPKLNLVYFGVDGPGPWSAKNRKGDNLFLDSVVAVNADTGEYVWHYQTVPNDTWDFNDCSPIVIADLPIRGTKRRVLLHAPKNGFFYVLDARTGKLLSAEKIAPVNWASRIDMRTGRPVENANVRYYAIKAQAAMINPGPLGVHNWHAMSYNELNGLIYLPISDLPVRYSMVNQSGTLGGDATVDYYSGMDDPRIQHKMGGLLAWDPVAQRQRWKVDLELPTNGGILSTAGNLVFEGTGTGDFIAYSAATGDRLWSFSTGSSIQAAPSTVTVDGEQVVLVAVGAGGAITLAAPRYSVTPQSLGPSRLLAFRLGASAALPVQPPTQGFPRPLNPPEDVASSTKGEALFSTYACDYCHGPKAERLGMSVPDLRRISKDTYEQLSAIVIGGARTSLGMPSFPDMPPEDLIAIRAYIVNQGWAAYNAEPPAHPSR